MAEFSFEQDIAPYATKFFGEIGADPNLSSAARTRLQGKLIGGLSEIETQRLKLEDERSRGRLNTLREREAVSALEDAQARRRRIEQESARIGDTKSRAETILSSELSPSEKEQRLGLLDLENSGIDDPGVRRVTDAARESLPAPVKSGFTPAQIASFAESVPPEILATQDPVLIGQYQGIAAERTKEMEERQKAVKENESEREKLLDVDLDFDDPDDEGNRNWLTPKSTMDATLIVGEFGTPEEKKKFETLRNAQSDQERARIVRDIQLRKTRERFRAATGTSTPLEKASRFTGLK